MTPVVPNVPLNSDADSPTEICLYIKKGKKTPVIYKVLTALGATTPARGNE